MPLKEGDTLWWKTARNKRKSWGQKVAGTWRFLKLSAQLRGCLTSFPRQVKTMLVGGWTNPSEKYARQIGSSSPIFGVKIKDSWNHQPECTSKTLCTKDPWLPRRGWQHNGLFVPTFLGSQTACSVQSCRGFQAGETAFGKGMSDFLGCKVSWVFAETWYLICVKSQEICGCCWKEESLPNLCAAVFLSIFVMVFYLDVLSKKDDRLKLNGK